MWIRRELSPFVRVNTNRTKQTNKKCGPLLFWTKSLVVNQPKVFGATIREGALPCFPSFWECGLLSYIFLGSIEPMCDLWLLNISLQNCEINHSQAVNKRGGQSWDCHWKQVTLTAFSFCFLFGGDCYCHLLLFMWQREEHYRSPFHLCIFIFIFQKKNLTPHRKSFHELILGPLRWVLQSIPHKSTLRRASEWMGEVTWGTTRTVTNSQRRQKSQTWFHSDDNMKTREKLLSARVAQSCQGFMLQIPLASSQLEIRQKRTWLWGIIADKSLKGKALVRPGQVTLEFVFFPSYRLQQV